MTWCTIRRSPINGEVAATPEHYAEHYAAYAAAVVQAGIAAAAPATAQAVAYQAAAGAQQAVPGAYARLPHCTIIQCTIKRPP